MTATELAIIDYGTGALIDHNDATAEQLREFAIAVRETFAEKDRDELEAIEALLTAVSKRLQQLGKEKAEAERSRTLALKRAGELLGPGKDTQGQRTDLFPDGNKLTAAEAKRRYRERLLADYPQIVKRELAKPNITLNQVVTACAFARSDKERTAASEMVAVIEHGDASSWLAEQDECDLLLTDPPYSTDVPDIDAFAQEWLPVALSRVKATGRAYVCIGAYPAEVAAYLAVKTPPHLFISQILAWTYRNTLGPSPAHDYKLNWQAILYYRGQDAPPLNCPSLVEKFSVQEFNHPAGLSGGNRWHGWQKPDGLAERFVTHASQPGDLVLDPFSGTGTFLLAAARLGRVARGGELDEEMLKLAVERGCQRA